MTRADFTGASCVDVADLELRLAAHWQALGRHELAAQAARFGARRQRRQSAAGGRRARRRAVAVRVRDVLTRDRRPRGRAPARVDYFFFAAAV